MLITESNIHSYMVHLNKKQRAIVLRAYKRYSIAELLKRLGELAPSHVREVYLAQEGDEGDRVVKTAIALVAQGYITEKL